MHLRKRYRNMNGRSCLLVGLLSVSELIQDAYQERTAEPDELDVPAVAGLLHSIDEERVGPLDISSHRVDAPENHLRHGRQMGIIDLHGFE
jgi:hypothetical protein